MSCGSLSATIRAPLPVPAPYLISAGVPAIPWRASLRRMLARAKRFAELRRQRLALLELDDRLLADIGISRADSTAWMVGRFDPVCDEQPTGRRTASRSRP